MTPADAERLARIQALWADPSLQGEVDSQFLLRLLTEQAAELERVKAELHETQRELAMEQAAGGAHFNQVKAERDALRADLGRYMMAGNTQAETIEKLRAALEAAPRIHSFGFDINYARWYDTSRAPLVKG